MLHYITAQISLRSLFDLFVLPFKDFSVYSNIFRRQAIIHEVTPQRTVSESLYLVCGLKGSLRHCWHAYIFFKENFCLILQLSTWLYFNLFLTAGLSNADQNIIEASWLAFTSCLSYYTRQNTHVLILKRKSLSVPNQEFNFQPQLVS